MTEDIKGLVDKAASALKAVGAKEVYVFGSAAHGILRENSDVDIAVSGLPPRSFSAPWPKPAVPWVAPSI